MDIKHQSAFIAGGGPAGLTAAYELLKRNSGVMPLVFELSEWLGGAARTEESDGLRLDLGGHRFFSSYPRIRALYNSHAKDVEMCDLERNASVYYHGKFTPYPLSLSLASISRMGLKFTLEASWGWITNKLTRDRIFLDERFTKSFSSPLWQLDSKRYYAERETSRFTYPTHGPGAFWNHLADEIGRMGGYIEREQRVSKLFFDSRDRRFISAEVTNAWGEKHIVPGDLLISTIPLAEMIGMIEGIDVPPEVREAARHLTHRRMFTVGILVERSRCKRFPSDDVMWVYIQDRSVRLGRVRIMNNWHMDISAEYGPDALWLALDYFPDENSDLAYLTTEAMTDLAVREFGKIAGLPTGYPLKTLCTREDYAFPVLTHYTRSQMNRIRDFLNHLPNAFVIGRNGQHARYAMSQSVLSALNVVDLIISGGADMPKLREALWDLDQKSRL